MSGYIVGVTGGIGSGKTTVTDCFAKKGITVIDADIVARQVVEPGTSALEAIVEKFGKGIVDHEQMLDRSALRKLIFAEPQLKSWLNALLHPLIRQQLFVQTKQAQSIYCLLSAPLLVENRLYTEVDRVLIIDVSEALQLQRTVLRDKTNQQQIQAIMNAQVSRAERLAVADDIIDNSQDIAHLYSQIDTLHNQYLQLAQ